MTTNHLLLYRLAELMLEHEQNTLPVDLLFDDEQIGDFVKSIQIDSPYQQMLLEGVLTESVRDEKLYVGFTVEGYFHFILGEVIYNQTQGLNPEVLKHLIENNELNGVNEGLEHCLIRDVQQDEYSRLMWLIDNNESNEISGNCIKPLATAFLNFKGLKENDVEYIDLIKNQIILVLRKLLDNPTENDFALLNKSISYLEYIGKNDVVKCLYQELNSNIKPRITHEAILFIKSIGQLKESDKNSKLELLEEKPIEADYYHTIGKQFESVADYNKAIKFHERALSIRQNNFGGTHPICGESYIELASNYKSQGDYDKSLDCCIKALKIFEEQYGNEHNLIGDVCNLMGVNYAGKNNLNLANKYYKKALEIRLKINGDQHPSTAKSYNNLGTFYNSIGEYDEALNNYNKSLKIFSNLKDPLIHIIYRNIGEVWIQKGDLEKAKEYFETSLSLRTAVSSDDHPDIARLYESLSDLWYRKNDFEKAKYYLEKSLKINNSIFGEFHLFTAWNLNKLGFIFSKNDLHKDAKEFYFRALKSSIKCNSNKDILQQIYSNIGLNSLEFNDNLKALEFYNKALEIQLEYFGKSHDDTILTYRNIGNIHLLLSDNKKAFYFLKKAAIGKALLHQKFFVRTSFLYGLYDQFYFYNLISSNEITNKKSKNYFLFWNYFYLNSILGWRLIFKLLNPKYRKEYDLKLNEGSSDKLKYRIINTLKSKSNVILYFVVIVLIFIPDGGEYVVELIKSSGIGLCIGFFIYNLQSAIVARE